MEHYNLSIEINGRMVFYSYSAKDEEDAKAKRKIWQSENLTPYDKWVIYFNGKSEDQRDLVYKYKDQLPRIRKTHFERVECWAKGFFKKKFPNNSIVD